MLENETLSSKLKKIENTIGNKINYDFSKFNLASNDDKNDNSSQGLSELKREINGLRRNNIQSPKREFLNKSNALNEIVVDFVFDDIEDKNENKVSNKLNLFNLNKDSNGNTFKPNIINNEDKIKLIDNKKNQNQKVSTFENLKIHDFLHSRHSDSRGEINIPKNETSNLNKVNLNKNNINISNNPFLNIKNGLLNNKKK